MLSCLRLNAFHNRLIVRSIVILVYLSVFFLSAPSAQAHFLTAAQKPAALQDFPVVDPNYVYSQFAYVTANFQQRQAGYVAGQGHDRFAAYWAQEMVRNLQGFGPQVRKDSFAIQGWQGRPASLPAFNMEVSVPGLLHPEQEIIVGCHYDGKANSTQSAYDDTSGCAYELGAGKAMADYWRSHQLYPERTIRFVLFDAEEQGLFGSFHYLNSTINGDLPNVTAMFNEEQSGINYPARFLGRLSNPFMPDYIDVTPLQNNAAYPGRIHLTPTQRQQVIRFRQLWPQGIAAVFAQFQAVGYSSLYYYGSDNQNVSQPIFTPAQESNIHIQDDPSSNSDQVPFIYAGLPVAMVTGDQSYYDPHPTAWAYPYDLPEDTLSLMNTYTGGTTRTSPALELALALPAMLTAWMLNQPDFGGSVPADGNPIAAISDIGQTVAGQSLALNASASFDPATGSNGDLSYAWNFGDGSGANSANSASGPIVSHTYTRTGSYQLSLTVTSPGGTRTIRKTLSVGASPNTYANPYSPLPGANTPNPAVTIPTPNNSLPIQPALPIVQTPTPSPTPNPTPTLALITPTPAPTVVSTVVDGPSTFTPTPSGPPVVVIIGIVLAVLIVLGAAGAVMVRRRGR